MLNKSQLDLLSTSEVWHDIHKYTVMEPRKTPLYPQENESRRADNVLVLFQKLSDLERVSGTP